MGMINIALHVQYRHTRSACYQVEITVANAPVDMSNGNTVEISSKDFANFFLGVAVGNLGALGFNKSGMPAQLRHTSFKTTSGAGAGEEE